MAQDPGSSILAALYQRQPAEARRLAEAAPALTIWEAAALGRDADVDALLVRDPALANAESPDGFFPLSLAAFFATAATVEQLIAAGAAHDTPSRNAMQVQPLHAAVASRNLDAVRVLLLHGADANARQQSGYTPLMGAAGSGREDLVDLLLEHGADPALAAEDGKTAMSIAREHGHAALADRLSRMVQGAD
jgi:uncharacterized protein